MRPIDAYQLKKDFLDLCEGTSPNSMIRRAVWNVISFIYAQPTLNVLLANWIPVKDRLPNAPGRYLVTYWDNVSKEQEVGINCFSWESSWEKKKNKCVTHWMPLPGTPEMEDE